MQPPAYRFVVPILWCEQSWRELLFLSLSEILSSSMKFFFVVVWGLLGDLLGKWLFSFSLFIWMLYSWECI